MTTLPAMPARAFDLAGITNTVGMVYPRVVEGGQPREPGAIGTKRPRTVSFPDSLSRPKLKKCTISRFPLLFKSKVPRDK